jgi:hypothetical protein
MMIPAVGKTRSELLVIFCFAYVHHMKIFTLQKLFISISNTLYGHENFLAKIEKNFLY